MKERVRLVIAMLLIRPLPQEVAAQHPARFRQVRILTWLAYFCLVCDLVSLVIAALDDNGSPGWIQGLHWFLGGLLLVSTACLFSVIFHNRSGIRPRRSLGR